MGSFQDYKQECVQAWSDLQETKPLVQCITNFVSMDIMANALNAIGASPAMVHSEDEVEEFAAIASAVVVNIGTLTKDWVASMKLAAKTAVSAHKPWVLDPVGAGATTFRTRTILELLDLRPALVRGNASEIMVLAGAVSGPSCGVDSTAASDQALEAASKLALRFDTIVAVSGEHDYITDGVSWLKVSNGVEMLTKITAAGCSVTAVIAAFISIARKRTKASTMEAAAYGLGIFGAAAEAAAINAEGPGSLRVGLLDQLHQLSSDSKRLQMLLKIKYMESILS